MRTTDTISAPESKDINLTSILRTLHWSGDDSLCIMRNTISCLQLHKRQRYIYRMLRLKRLRYKYFLMVYSSYCSLHLQTLKDVFQNWTIVIVYIFLGAAL